MAPTQGERINELMAQLAELKSRFDAQESSRQESGSLALPRDFERMILIPEVNEATPEVDCSDSVTLSKLIGIVCKLKRDMSNFSTWESSLLNALDLVNVDENAMKEMVMGQKRPSNKLNKILRTLIHHTIDKDDKVINNKIRQFLRPDSASIYKLNSSVAMFETVRKYYYDQIENREDVLLRKLKEFRFSGSNLVRYNTAYSDIYAELKDMGCVSGTKKEVKEYIDSLGSGSWTYDVRKVYENMKDRDKTIENMMEVAVKMFLIQFPDGKNRNHEEPRQRNAFRVQLPKSERNKILNCSFCTKSHDKGRGPAFGKDCS